MKNITITIACIALFFNLQASSHADDMQVETLWASFTTATENQNFKRIAELGAEIVEKSNKPKEEGGLGIDPVRIYKENPALGVFATPGMIFMSPFLAFNKIESDVNEAMIKNPSHKPLDDVLTKSRQEFFFRNLGHAHKSLGNIKEAISAYKQAISLSEAFRLTIRREDRRIGFYRSYDTLFQNLIPLLIQNGQAEEALRYIELSKSKTLREGLQASSIARLERKIIRAELISQANFEAAMKQPVLNQKQQEATRGISIITKDVKASKKTNLLVKNLKIDPFNPAILNQILPSFTCVNYYVTPEYIISIVISEGEIIKTQISNRQENIEERIDSLRQALLESNLEDARTTGKELYSFLIAPIQDAVAGKPIIISPHDILHALPFGALYSDKFWGNEVSVSTAYSLSILPKLFDFSKETQNRPKIPLIMGDPENSLASFERLKGAEQEAKAIYSILKQKGLKPELLLGHDASEDALRKKSVRHNMLHFATHSIFNPDDGDKSFMLLSNSSMNDGILQIDEIYSLEFKLGLKLVFMASCSSGSSEIRYGDEAFGLTRAWFFSGAERVVSTYFPVTDESAKLFSVAFYKHLANEAEPFAAFHLATAERLAAGDMQALAFKLEGLP